MQTEAYQYDVANFNGSQSYFSSYSKSSLKDFSDFADQMFERLQLNSDSQVIELASNEGYLLQYFLRKDVRVMGIDPKPNMAEIAIAKGIKTVIEFFTLELAENFANNWNVYADLLIANNVLNQVSDFVDFVAGMKVILAENGVITAEFPHLMPLVEDNQFDTIYHEHLSYLSFQTAKAIFESEGLEVFDVEELPKYGGSIRLYLKHAGNSKHILSPRVQTLVDKEYLKGVHKLEYYQGFQEKATNIKMGLWEFLFAQRKAGCKVAAYGAAPEGNTVLNFCGVKKDFLEFVVDGSPDKQNKFLPGSCIPIMKEEILKNERPDFVIIIPWKRSEEISGQLSYIRDWNAKFVVLIPEIRVF